MLFHGYRDRASGHLSPSGAVSLTIENSDGVGSTFRLLHLLLLTPSSPKSSQAVENSLTLLQSKPTIRTEAWIFTLLSIHPMRLIDRRPTCYNVYLRMAAASDLSCCGIASTPTSGHPDHAERLQMKYVCTLSIRLVLPFLSYLICSWSNTSSDERILASVKLQICAINSQCCDEAPSVSCSHADHERGLTARCTRVYSLFCYLKMLPEIVLPVE